MSVARVPFQSAAIILLLVFMVNPCLAGEKFISGGPNLNVGIAGDNELIPGETVDLPLTVNNNGTIDIKLVNTGDLIPDYLPTTALSVQLQAKSGNTPFIIKSDPQILGDIPAGTVETIAVTVTVPETAVAGQYELPVTLTYRYVPLVTQIGDDYLGYNFKDESVTRYLPVTVRPRVVLTLLDVDTTGLHAGGEGYIGVKVMNSGTDTGNYTSLIISPPEGSPVTPIDRMIFIGDFPPGKVAEARFRVSVTHSADPSQVYPIDIYADYRDYEGLEATSQPIPAGVRFGGKITFEVTSPPAVITAGQTGTISVTYRNTGDAIAKTAQVRLSIVDPFSSNDDNAYLGNLAPGEEATALFSVQVDSDATVKEYALDSEIQYTDDQDTTYLSDPVKVLIKVSEPGMITTYIGVIVLIILIIAGIAYWHHRKRSG